MKNKYTIKNKICKNNKSKNNKIGGVKIGEGTYGCVHKPPLKCKNDQNVNYDKKITKIMKYKDAIKELKEYNKVDDVDKKYEYHLDKPIICEVDINYPKNIKEIEECNIKNDFYNNNIYTNRINNRNKYYLLLMKDGGMDLSLFSEKMKNQVSNNINKSIMKDFWKEAIRLFYGILHLNNNNVIHADLKHQNIVYNIGEKRCNFIDFGLMTDMKKFRESCNTGNNFYIDTHWSYPFEFYFMNENVYKYLVNNINLLKSNKKYMTDCNFSYDFFKNLITNNNKYKSKRNIEKSMNIFFNELKLNNNQRMEYVNAFYTSIMTEYTMDNMNDLMDKSISSIDTYGLGIALFRVLNYTKHLINKKMYYELRFLFTCMTTPILKYRYDTFESYSVYRDIINKYYP